MKILYLSDKYGFHNMGTKRSLFCEMKRRGFDITWRDVRKPLRASAVSDDGYSWVWVAHSWPGEHLPALVEFHQAGARVLGFGFSDPYALNMGKLSRFDAYATNHHQTFDDISKAGDLPVCLLPTACDKSAHENAHLRRSTDILIYGLGEHPRFSPRDYRITMAARVLLHFEENVQIVGTKWGDLPAIDHVRGLPFFAMLNRAKVALDLQQEHAPIAHRVFECLACGTPVVTRRRPELLRMFPGGLPPGMLAYDDFGGLKDAIAIALEFTGEDRDLFSEYTREHHDISNRVEALLRWFQSL